MEQGLQISWRGVPPSPALEADIREKAAKLEQFFNPIISCRVVVEAPQTHRRHGKLYRLRIDVHVPGHTINVSHDPSADHSHEDMYVTIRDAFGAARRQLQDPARFVHGDIRTSSTNR